MRAFALLPFALFLATIAQSAEDLRAAYDVQTYRLDLKVNPETRSLVGTVGVAAKVTAAKLDVFELDLMEGRTVQAVNWIDAKIGSDSSMSGLPLRFERVGDRIKVHLPKQVAKAGEVRVGVQYSFQPAASERRSGIRFAKTPDGKPWISTSCQSLGAHSWWPCKNENEHPEDKFATLIMNVTVPQGLMAVCNGKMLKRQVGSDGWETFHWQYDYPCENYAVTLNVAPYVQVDSQVSVAGLSKPVPFSYYVLPQDLEKAKLQFEEAPKVLKVYSDAFGPFPYAGAKFALVQTDFWGMEHSSAVAYGNSFPAWIKKNGGTDQWAPFNKLFDYIIVHEVAHEWWGNAVSAADWGHLWLHEGFGTYAETVYVERTISAKAAEEWFAFMRPKIAPRFREFRGTGVLPSKAFDNNVYYKGAWILNTLRYYVNNDRAWWKALREFNMRFRYKNARTEDFQKVLEEITGESWKQFFAEWFYGDAYPTLKGTVSIKGRKVVIDIDNPAIGDNVYHVPLFVSWTDNGIRRTVTANLKPGPNHIEINCGDGATGLQLLNLSRVLGDIQIAVSG